MSLAAVHAEARLPETSRAASPQPQEEVLPDVQVLRVSQVVAGVSAAWWQQVRVVAFQVPAPTPSPAPRQGPERVQAVQVRRVAVPLGRWLALSRTRRR